MYKRIKDPYILWLEICEPPFGIGRERIDGSVTGEILGSEKKVLVAVDKGDIHGFNDMVIACGLKHGIAGDTHVGGLAFDQELRGSVAVVDDYVGAILLAQGTFEILFDGYQLFGHASVDNKKPNECLPDMFFGSIGHPLLTQRIEHLPFAFDFTQFEVMVIVH